MNRIIILIVLVCGVISVFSQTDSLLLKSYEQKILENSKLKSDLQAEKQNYADLNARYEKETQALQKIIQDLRNEVSSEKQKVSDLNKNKILDERSNLQKKIDSLTVLISDLNNTISDKDKLISSERTNAKTAAASARKTGQTEALESIIDSYKNRTLDELIISSTKESVARDNQLVGNNPEIKLILNELLVYFNAKELLVEKFEAVHLKSALTNLMQIKRQSKLVTALKEEVEFYQDFNTALKETITKIINLDNEKSAEGDSEIQKKKFNDIVLLLTEYMYNYYDYTNYPYLLEIVIEIIKRKQPNADADIKDLLIKL